MGNRANIVLVGFMGTGKTVVGRALAARLERPFFDTDDWIAERAGMSIPALFERRGEAAFRDLESESVARAAGLRRAVIATGGGVLGRPENVERLKATGVLICLRARPEVILARTAPWEDRPMLAGAPDPRARVEELLAARADRYALADYRVDTSDLTVEGVISAIQEAAPEAMPTIEVSLADHTYPIVFAPGALGRSGDWMDRLGLGQRVAIISHPWLLERYGETVLEALRRSGRQPDLLSVPPGESSKTLGEAERLYLELARLRLDRSSVIFALGGGVIGDLAGFVAATYLRGIAYVQAPTTLLAQVDASVGGKTAVDLPVGKNLVGAFHQPSMVIADIETLATLPPRELRAGLAEVIKYGVIADPALFSRLERESRGILAGEPSLLMELVKRSCEIKAAVVAADERESGPRETLNFGHTVGHAVEALTGYRELLHGEAVGIGMAAASRIASRLALLEERNAERISALVGAYGLPTLIPAGLTPEAILKTMQLDKKSRDLRPRFVLPTRIGAVEYGCEVPEELLLEALLGQIAPGDRE